MARTINMGKVVGSDGQSATINGETSLTMTGTNGVDLTQNGSTVTLSAPGLATHTADQNNPHSVTKAQIGLGNVENKSAATILAELGNATTSASGRMSSTDKSKLDNVEEYANKTVVDSALSSSSTNPVQNKVVKAALDTKQDKLTGTTNQVVGFNAAGEAVAVDIQQKNVNMSGNIFGFELDLTESNPFDKVRYIGDNAGFKPVQMDFVANTFDSGDWGNAWFMNVKPCVLGFDGTVKYELDKNDYSKKSGGAAATIDENADGNVMIGIPTVYIKVDTTVANKPKFYFAATQVDNTYKAYAHMDEDGAVIPYIYMPAYNGWVDGSSRLRSVSGKVPRRDQTGTVQVTEARANNASGAKIWDLEGLSERELITLLLVLIGKSTDCQAVFGKGNENGYYDHADGSDTNGVLSTGTMNDKGLFWGSNVRNLGVKVFGIENFWGNIWRRTQGYINANGTLKAKLTRSTADGSTATDYNETGEGYITIGSAPSGNGYISNMYVNQYGLFGKETSGSDTTHFADHEWVNNSQVDFALFGGHSNNGSSVGPFACYLNFLVSHSYWNFGASPSCKPKKAA